MAPRSMLIVNPVSGKGRVKDFIMDIINAFCVAGEGLTIYVTEKHGDAAAFAEKHGAEYDRIACTGGDGTLNEVISGLMRLPKELRPAIGYVPLGTTNDMAVSLNLPKTPKGAIARLGDGFQLQEDPRTVDVGQLGSDYFGYVAAFGAFTDIPFTTPQEAKNTWGYLAYVTEALNRLNRIPSIHARIEYDEGVVEDDYLVGFVVNSTSVAGIVKFPEEDVSLDDGLFEILLIRAPKRLIDLNVAVTQVLRKEFNTEHITFLHTKKAHFEFTEPIQWTRDGEDGGLYKVVDVTNFHKAVRIFV